MSLSTSKRKTDALWYAEQWENEGMSELERLRRENHIMREALQSIVENESAVSPVFLANRALSLLREMETESLRSVSAYDEFHRMSDR